MSAQSYQFTVLEAAHQVLGGDAAGAFRCRFSAFALDKLSAGADNLIPEDETPEYINSDDTEQKFRFHVRHMAAAVDGADQVADARYVRGAQLLLGGERNLGGAVRILRLIGRKWEMEKAEQQLVVVVATYEAEYSTSNIDPSVRGF